MAIACWPCRKYIDFRVGQLQYIYKLQFEVYKIDRLACNKNSIKFSCIAQYESISFI